MRFETPAGTISFLYQDTIQGLRLIQIHFHAITNPNMSALWLQVLPYHPSMKLIASMSLVEGPFCTLISSDLEFLQAQDSENTRAQPITTNHLTSDTTVSQTVPMYVKAHNIRGFCSCHGTYLPKSTSSIFFVHAKSRIPPNRFNKTKLYFIAFHF